MSHHPVVQLSVGPAVLGTRGDGDTLKLRHQLRSEHDAEVQQISQAAEVHAETEGFKGEVRRP